MWHRIPGSAGLALVLALATGIAQGQTTTTKPSLSDAASVVGPSMQPPTTTPPIKQSVITPKAQLPERQVQLPAVMTYQAALTKVKGTVPARLGGWSCTNSLCTLRTSGPATEAEMQELCRGLWRLMKESPDLSFDILKFSAAKGAELSRSRLAACVH